MSTRARTWLLGVALLCVAPEIADAKQRPASESTRGLPLVRIPGGEYTPLYGAENKRAAAAVAPFMLMSRPVTNADFARFVQEHPAYRRDRIARALADADYLSHWASPDALGAARAAQPVTRVSWFAAKAFCESHGLRLPTEAEWELAAAASETSADGSTDPSFRETILRWYATPDGPLPDVPHGHANLYGVHDLHGVIWEWVDDFATAALDNEAQSGKFCGGTGALSGDNTDYPAFMRAALRSSLKASYTLANLGFRCAADGAGPAPVTHAQSLYDLDLALTDQHGDTLTLSTLSGHPVVAAMFYASCTTICPMLIEQIKHIDATLDPDVRAQTRYLLITLDPEHDTTERLAALAKLHAIDDPRWHFTRSSPEKVRDMASLLGVVYQPAGGGTFNHSSTLTLLDGEGTITLQRQAGTASANDLSAAIARMQ